MTAPSSTRAFILGSKSPRQLGEKTIQYYSASVQDVPLPKGEVVVKVLCAGFNHRERYKLNVYPTNRNRGFRSRTPTQQTSSRRAYGRMGEFGIVGGVSHPAYGTFSEYVALDAKSVILAPEHMSDEEAGAWALGAVTAWRAVVTKAQVEKGHNVLIVRARLFSSYLSSLIVLVYGMKQTGIGGGVAMIALRFAVALGANVFVSSSNKQTIDWAIEAGAKGGVNYRDESWPRDLAALLKEHNITGIDAIIDSAGGDLLGKTGKSLNPGAKVVCYGMTASPSIPLAMPAVLKNVDLLGSTMGSTAELQAATDFAAKHKLKPSVSVVLEGLENAERGFELIEKGRESGKIVVRVGTRSGSESKL
ncbi:Zinc-binding dehydrogenase, partial [Rhizoctonia solani]